MFKLLTHLQKKVTLLRQRNKILTELKRSETPNNLMIEELLQTNFLTVMNRWQDLKSLDNKNLQWRRKRIQCHLKLQKQNLQRSKTSLMKFKKSQKHESKQNRLKMMKLKKKMRMTRLPRTTNRRSYLGMESQSLFETIKIKAQTLKTLEKVHRYKAKPGFQEIKSFNRGQTMLSRGICQKIE